MPSVVAAHLEGSGDNSALREPSANGNLGAMERETPCVKRYSPRTPQPSGLRARGLKGQFHDYFSQHRSDDYRATVADRFDTAGALARAKAVLVPPLLRFGFSVFAI